MSFYGMLLVSVSMLAIVSVVAIGREATATYDVYGYFSSYANLLAVQSFRDIIASTEPMNMTSYQGWRESLISAATADGIRLNTTGNAFVIRSASKPRIYAVIIVNLSSERNK